MPERSDEHKEQEPASDITKLARTSSGEGGVPTPQFGLNLPALQKALEGTGLKIAQGAKPGPKLGEEEFFSRRDKI